MKLLIVDDESTTRNGLVKFIPWGELGIDLVEQAENGSEALKMAEQARYDIVLSDIRMPNMDGIEFARRTKKILPECKIIFLSGYADKEYLKAAIDLGAVSYVEKPINIAEITGAVRKAAQEHRNGRVEQEKHRELSRVITQDISLIKSRIIQSLVRPNCNTVSVGEYMRMIGEDFPRTGCFFIVIVKLHRDCFGQNNQLDMGAVWKMTADCFSSVHHLDMVKEENRCMVVFCEDSLHYQKSVKQTFAKVRDGLNSLGGNSSAFFAVGQRTSTLDTVYKSYQTAEIILQRLFFLGYDHSVFYGITHEMAYQADEQLYKTFTRHLADQDREGMQALVDSLCSDLLKNQSTMVSNARNIFNTLLFTLFGKAEEQQILLNASGEKGEESAWESAGNCETLVEVRQYLQDKLNRYFNELSKRNTGNLTISNVIKYMNQHYGEENLSLKQLADYVLLTPNYLSYCFKKETQKTVSEYIAEIRIRNSKYLLMNPQLKLYEVANQVGYSDANYYAKAFKKLEGITPSEYREKQVQ